MPMTRAALTLLTISIPLPAPALLLGDAGNGARLHAVKCVACHNAQFAGKGEQMYLREGRMVKSIEGLLARVEFCNKQTRAGLTEDEINDVVRYLNESFYQFEVR